MAEFDEIFAPAYCEDSDLAFRIRAAGRKVYYCPFSLVTTSVGAQGPPGLEHTVSIADDPQGLADAAVKLLLDDPAWTEASVRQIRYARGHFSRDAFRRSFLEETRAAPP